MGNLIVFSTIDRNFLPFFLSKDGISGDIKKNNITFFEDYDYREVFCDRYVRARKCLCVIHTNNFNQKIKNSA